MFDRSQQHIYSQDLNLSFMKMNLLSSIVHKCVQNLHTHVTMD